MNKLWIWRYWQFRQLLKHEYLNFTFESSPPNPNSTRYPYSFSALSIKLLSAFASGKLNFHLTSFGQRWKKEKYIALPPRIKPSALFPHLFYFFSLLAWCLTRTLRANPFEFRLRSTIVPRKLLYPGVLVCIHKSLMAFSHPTTHKPPTS